MASPAVHPAESLNDALAMLDSHVPLTHRERVYIIESLYDLAFREGARQGRLAGRESVYGEIKAKAAELRGCGPVDGYTAAVLEALIPESERGEYPEPTVAIRRTLEEKRRAVRDRINGG